MRVKTVLLAIESQYMRQSRRTQNGHLPVSPGSPIQHANRPYRDARRQRRHGRLKTTPINVNQVQNVERTHLKRASAVQSPANNSKHLNRVIGPRCQCGRIKIGPVKVKIKDMSDKPAREDEKTYRGHPQATQPLRNPPKRRSGVIGLICRRGRFKTEPRNISQALKIENAYLRRDNVLRSMWRPIKGIRRLDGSTFEPRAQGEHCCRCGRLKIKAMKVNATREGEMTYCRCASTAQPPQNPSRRACGVIGPRHRHGWTKLRSINVRRTQNGRRAYLGCVNAI